MAFCSAFIHKVLRPAWQLRRKKSNVAYNVIAIVTHDPIIQPPWALFGYGVALG